MIKNKKLIEKTDKYVWYQCGDVHWLHVFSDKRTNVTDKKSLITKHIESVRKRIKELN